VLLALILVPWTINRITRSIRKVTEGAEAIAAGDLDQHIDVDSRDETRLLADAFNRMSASLKKTLGDLQALTEELEDRVERRTAQLAKSNHQLEEINAQLEVANREIQAGTQRKSAFLASMSHDLRTLMNAIIGYTRILLRKAEGALELRLYRNLENIETSSNNLLALINEILDLSRVESGRIEIKPTDVDLKQLVEECAASVEPLVKEGVVLQQPLADVPTIVTDGELLRRVLMNLLGNAVKFTERGTITLSVQSVADGIGVSVADTGIGIPPEDFPHIFEEFRQVDRDGAEAQGSGLGLAIVKKTVELLGGTIKAESSVGEGTRFTLTTGNYKQ
jgi:signal transduction histidine kinase